MKKHQITKQVYLDFLAKNPNKNSVDFENFLEEKIGESIFGNTEKIMVTIFWDGNRGFDGINETFICEEKDWKELFFLLRGKEVYFGEIAGKHSEVYGLIEERDISVSNKIDYCKVGNNHSFLHTLLEDLNGYGEKNKEEKELYEKLNKFIGKYKIQA